ncbi:MAG: hypothetical protein JHC26_06675 [Thermofilum sp.]|uniref:hypothetical protein n=1 Tax=Thermofilum sp. TaxID=1961369 RepID=UPI00258B0962|nr:hypothetical protein [Thermofilum sp.]MCI4408758.1 hypothetical protein [Thermofilum sp.]
MSWRNVPKKENYFPLFAEDWNALVDAVDDLYYMLQALPPSSTGGPLVGGFVYGDIIPWLDLYYSLGNPTHRFLNVWAKNIYADPIWTTTLYASNNILVNNKPVLKDGDPISIYDIQNQAQNVLSNILQQYVTGPLNDYKNQVINQLVTIQSLLQNTNTLINSHLARELYETYSYMFQFNYPNGVIPLIIPQPGYHSIIRGWYAISTGTSGLGQIKGSYSLTPVGLIPFSISSLSFPDTFLGLYYDEPLLFYYNNVSIGTYLHLMLNIIQEWTGISLYDPSFINPYDPTWTPPDGWTYVFRFIDISEVSQAFNYTSGYEVVSDGILQWNIPSGKSASVERYINGQSWKKIAVCLRINIGKVAQDQSNVIYFNPTPSTDMYFGVGLHVKAGSSTMKIKDWMSGGGDWDPPIYDFTPPNDWFVIVMDVTSKQSPYFSIYDRNKNLLFQLALQKSSITSVYEDLYFDIENETSFGTWDIKIDWIAFKY